MSRRLILTRHAKSGWDDPALDDHDRPLNARGRQAAPAVGAWLRRRGYLPQAALLSTARRVAETWEGLGFGPEVEVTRQAALYLCDPGTMLAHLAGQRAGTVILIAHNPGIGSLAHRLTRDPPARDEFRRFPTCATLVLDFDAADWASVVPRSGHAADFTVPRDLA